MSSPIPPLIYPAAALFPTLSWIHQSFISIKLAHHVRDEIEPKLPSLVWEQVLDFYQSFI